MVRKFITGAAVALGLAAPMALNSTAQASDYYRPGHHGHAFHHRHHKSYCVTYRRGYDGPWCDYGTYGSPMVPTNEPAKPGPTCGRAALKSTSAAINPPP